MTRVLNVRNIQWNKLASLMCRFAWAFSVLVFRLLVILTVRLACLALDVRNYQQSKASRPTERPKAEYIPAAKPYAMYLDKADPQFLMKRERLQKEGYLWHSGLRAWMQPTVKIDRNQSNFCDQTLQLKKLGYVWSRQSGQWELTFPKYQVIHVYQHRVITEAES